MSTIKLSEKFKLSRLGSNETSYIQNHCSDCGWSGNKHYAHNDYQHSNCKEERVNHNLSCEI